jgi:hypothetical protein
LLSLLLACSLHAQEIYVPDTIANDEIVTQEYDPAYHFDDSAQSRFNHSDAEPEFNKEHWRKITRDMTFSEADEQKDTTKKKKKEPKKESSGLKLPSMKYLWIIICLIILGFVIYKTLPAFNRKNIKNKDKLIISLDELDEEDIKSIEIATPLEQALKDGDYRTAYRLRYLSVLKQLIGRNLILYKRDKTNYEYLLQLSGLPVYEPFRLLTFNFDGIWYGDLMIDKAKYDSLDMHFTDFNKAIQI